MPECAIGRGRSIGVRSGYCDRQRRAENRIVDAPVPWVDYLSSQRARGADDCVTANPTECFPPWSEAIPTLTSLTSLTSLIGPDALPRCGRSAVGGPGRIPSWCVATETTAWTKVARTRRLPTLIRAVHGRPTTEPAEVEQKTGVASTWVTESEKWSAGLGQIWITRPHESEPTTGVCGLAVADLPVADQSRHIRIDASANTQRSAESCASRHAASYSGIR